MAELPRLLFRVSLPGSRDRGGSAMLTLAWLWSHIYGSAKARGGPHFLETSIKEVADGRGFDIRTADTHLQQLREVGLIVSGTMDGKRGYWLRTPKGYEDKKQPPDRPWEEFKKELIDRGSATIPLIDRGSPTIDNEEIDDRYERDPRSITKRSTIDKDPPKEVALNHSSLSSLTAAAAGEPSVQPRTAAAAAAGGADLRSEARSLLTELAAPLAAFPTLRQLRADDRRTVELLAALLAAEDLGARRLHVADQILAYAAVCAGDPAQHRFFNPEMFRQDVRPGGAMSPWAAVENTVADGRLREAQRAAAERAAAERQAAVEAEREAQRQRQAQEQAFVAQLKDPAELARLAEEARARMAAEQRTSPAEPSSHAQRRREDEARKLAETRAEEQALVRARDAAKQQGGELLEQRRGEAGDELDRLEDLGLEALMLHRQKLSRQYAEALNCEDNERALALSQQKLIVTRRIVALSGKSADVRSAAQPQENS